MRVFITGDTHIPYHAEKLFNDNLKELTKEDILIVAGDFGLIWSNIQDDFELEWINKLNEMPYTTCFVDGNHENFDRLEKYPTIEKWGGNVGVISDSIFHLKRGEVFNFNDKKFFTFGGATSIDRSRRTEFIDWWKQEIPNYAEISYAFSNLEKHNYKVDCIITHTCPSDFIETLKYEADFYFLDPAKVNDPVVKLLNEFLNRVSFNEWFFGHFHTDVMFEYRSSKDSKDSKDNYVDIDNIGIDNNISIDNNININNCTDVLSNKQIFALHNNVVEY